MPTNRYAKYGITEDDYNAILERQGHKCPICDRRFVKTPAIDHDHKCCKTLPACGKCVRGVIHTTCNRALGQLFDRADIALNAYNYLSSYEESRKETSN